MEEKKIILVYADWIELFEALDNEEAGKLIKHFFRYVNDLNPEYPDRLTELSFIPIKQSLKRDLEKWIGTKEERSYNGRKGNLRKYNPDLFDRFSKEEITLEEAEQIAKSRKVSPPDKNTRIATSSVANVAVNDNVNVNDNINNTKVERIDFDILLAFINQTFKRNFKVISKKVRDKFNARLKEGYIKEDLKIAITNCSKNKFHIDNNFQYCTPEYFSRSEVIDKYSNVSNNEPEKEIRITDPDRDHYEYIMSQVEIAKSFQK